MSITRRGCDGSDIYLYESSDNSVCCSGCNLREGEDFQILTDIDALEHIRIHIKSGDKVPQHAIDYFNGRVYPKIKIVSNVTEEDINRIHPSPKIPKYELRFKALDEAGELIREFALVAWLQDRSNEDKIKKLHAILFSMERTIEKTIEKGDI